MKKNEKKSVSALEDLGKDVVGSMKVTDKVTQYVESIKRKKAKSALWHQVRTGKITGSVAHVILHTNMKKPAHSTNTVICKESTVSTTPIPSLNWGSYNIGIVTKVISHTR